MQTSSQMQRINNFPQNSPMLKFIHWGNDREKVLDAPSTLSTTTLSFGKRKQKYYFGSSPTKHTYYGKGSQTFFVGDHKNAL